MECKIIICSHKRAGEVKTKVAGGILFVSESQAAEYRACNPDYEIETHPDSLIGLPAKRQACVDRFKPCFMMDDDLGGVQRVYRNPGDLLSAGEVAERIQITYELAKDIGVHLFGFVQIPRPAFYNSARPLLLSGAVCGGAYGVTEDFNLKWDQGLKLGEDHYISLLNAYHNRKCLVDTRFSFLKDKTFCKGGGLQEIRTNEEEKRTLIRLKMLFGNAVEVKRKQKLNVKSRYSRTIKIPF